MTTPPNDSDRKSLAKGKREFRMGSNPKLGCQQILVAYLFREQGESVGGL